MPSGPTMKLPLRKSPCTSAGAAVVGGALSVEPAQAELERGMRLAEHVERASGTASICSAAPSSGELGEFARCRPRGCSPRSRRTARRARDACRRTRRRAGCAARSSRPRPDPSRSHDRDRPSGGGGGRRGAPARRRRGRGEERVLGGTLGSSRRCSAGIAPQHQWMTRSGRGHEIERPRLPRGATRQAAYGADRAVAVRRGQCPGQCDRIQCLTSHGRRR